MRGCTKQSQRGFQDNIGNCNRNGNDKDFLCKEFSVLLFDAFFKKLFVKLIHGLHTFPASILHFVNEKEIIRIRQQGIASPA